ncbi:hypothetical protein BDV19DRAFT_370372 [Aspergillus venezuelensis]
MAAMQNIPYIHLLCLEQKHIDAFQAALLKYWPDDRRQPAPAQEATPGPGPQTNAAGHLLSQVTAVATRTFNTKPSEPPVVPRLNIEIHNNSLKTLPETVQYDLIVSPANSYGLMDGAFDDAISRTFREDGGDYCDLTNAVQRSLYDKWRGFAPSGTCTLVPFPENLMPEMNPKNLWGCKWVAVCPTMRTPNDVRWDREVVYECVWSLFNELERWNRTLDVDLPSNAPQLRQPIESILITPMATGCGRVSPERWAEQFVLALRHFVEAVTEPDRWSRLRWDDVYADTEEVESTWKEKS